MRCSLGESLRAVNFATCCLDPASLIFVIRFVVSTEHSSVSTCIHGHEAARIAHVYNIGGVIYYNNTNRAAARSLWTYLLTRISLLSLSLSHLNQMNKVAFAFLESRDDAFLRMQGELLILDDKVVQIVAQVVRAGSPSVSIEDAKEANLGPFDTRWQLLVLWLEDVENDADSVLIVLSNDALVCVGGVGFDVPAFLLRSFRRLVILQVDRLGIQNWCVPEK